MKINLYQDNPTLLLERQKLFDHPCLSTQLRYAYHLLIAYKTLFHSHFLFYCLICHVFSNYVCDLIFQTVGCFCIHQLNRRPHHQKDVL